ncbi:glycosyltransferase family 39 protein [Legionella clemsonensis]|uniref:Glycosyltransferase RgtA/B/C/D-like domain-containing protein n=1 Tax=Legionella clemsonensis TaxID=1867846 RepID=A0A222P4M7_9GAMM|nr:glycosyltransferase family 39 protein [Legionella clemsonensis]ASQ46810.1 hypothetical protein clem_11335 [Legionella clemsonensis]
MFKFSNLTPSQQGMVCFALLTAFFILARLFLCNATLGLDEAEQIVFAQKLSAGYPSQPPLYTWLQYMLFQGLGVSLLSIALLKYSLLFLSVYIYHQICHLYIKDSLLTWCATLSWTLIPNISYDLLPHRTHAILALLAACLTWYWLIKPSQASKWHWSLIFGFIVSIGLLSKFNYLLFLAGLILTALSVKEYRHKLLDWPILITIVAALLLTSPYWFWLVNNLKTGLYSSYKLAIPGKSQWHGIVRLFEVSACFAIPLIVIRLFFPVAYQRRKVTSQNQLLWRYHLIVLPFLLVVVISAGIHNVKTHWVLPLFFLTPLWLFTLVDQYNYSSLYAKRFLGLCVVVQLAFISLWILRTPYLAQFPLKDVVKEIKQERHSISAIVSDSHWLLGSLMLLLPKSDGILMHAAKPITLPGGDLLFIWEGEQRPWWMSNLAAVSSQPMSEAVITRNDKAAISHLYRVDLAV